MPLPFEIRPSAMQGFGAFATETIPAGVRLIEYAGARLTPEEAEARYPDVPGERHHTYLFAIDDVRATRSSSTRRSTAMRRASSITRVRRTVTPWSSMVASGSRPFAR